MRTAPLPFRAIGLLAVVAVLTTCLTVVEFLSAPAARAAIPDRVITTWNMQGANDEGAENKWLTFVFARDGGLAGRAMRDGDVVALQEAGDRPASAVERPADVAAIPVDNLGDPSNPQEFWYNIGTQDRPEYRYIYWMRSYGNDGAAEDDNGNPVFIRPGRVNLAIVTRQRPDRLVVLPGSTTSSARSWASSSAATSSSTSTHRREAAATP